jgi:hypothetical protein
MGAVSDIVAAGGEANACLTIGDFSYVPSVPVGKRVGSS